nr:uncharacterized protein At4g02000-like [Quercus suber]
MEDLETQWARFSLKTKESSTIDLPPMVESHNHILVAKLFTKRRVNLEALTKTLRSMWRSVRSFEVRDLGSNTVLIIFEDETDPQKLMVQGPWTFDKYLVGLYRPTGEELVDDATFDKTTFWVQMHNLPLRRMNKTTAEAIGKTLGIVEHVDASATGECRGRYLRVRIQLDITQPLCRGRMVNIGKAELQWVAFQYEKLSIFCYWCGLLNHDEKDCTLWFDSGETFCTEEQQYGAWLCAPINTLQQPKMATDKPTPQPKHPSGPPRPPCPTPSPTVAGTSTATKPTAPVTPTVPIPAPPTSMTEPNISKHTTAHPDMDPPTFPQQITHIVPTNTKILTDTDLFNTYISEIDNALNIYPFPSKSASL